jgi:hypothetical protein
MSDDLHAGPRLALRTTQAGASAGDADGSSEIKDLAAKEFKSFAL